MNDKDLDELLKRSFGREKLPLKEFGLEVYEKRQLGAVSHSRREAWLGRFAAAFCFVMLGFMVGKFAVQRESEGLEPMEDAMSAYTLYEHFGDTRDSVKTDRVLQWFSAQAQQSISAPELEGFELVKAEPLSSAHGAAMLLSYHKPKGDPLLLFIRQDVGHRAKGLHWRVKEQRQVAYFYHYGLAFAIRYSDPEVSERLFAAIHSQHLGASRG